MEIVPQTQDNQETLQATIIAAEQVFQQAVQNQDDARNPITRRLRGIAVSRAESDLEYLKSLQHDSSEYFPSIEGYDDEFMPFQAALDRLITSKSRIANGVGIVALYGVAIGAATYEMTADTLTKQKRR